MSRLRSISVARRSALSRASAGLGRTERWRMPCCDSGPAMLMIEAEWPTLPSRAPNVDGSSPVVIYVYVADVDATVDRALAHGATLVVPVATQFWGDRIGWVRDAAGHMWTIATRVEEASED